MSAQDRAAGWYADPWGTNDERYYDGDSWTHAVRQPGGLESPPDGTPGVTAASAPASAPAPPVDATVPERPSDDPQGGKGLPAPGVPPPPLARAVPPGWHPDPWGTAPLRWWDGARWTGHVSGASGGTTSMESASTRLGLEREAGRWARVAMVWAGPAFATMAIAGAFQCRWVAEHWSEITKPGYDATQGSGNTAAALFFDVGVLALLAAMVLFMIWFYRAACTAAAAGLPARRTPGLATASFLIPVLNLWWPYESGRDLLPEGHPARSVLRRWWLLWIGCAAGAVAIFATAFIDAALLALATSATVVLALLTASAARAVVAHMMDAHAGLVT